jgi:hypothetical protein
MHRLAGVLWCSPFARKSDNSRPRPDAALDAALESEQCKPRDQGGRPKKPASDLFCFPDAMQHEVMHR